MQLTVLWFCNFQTEKQKEDPSNELQTIIFNFDIQRQLNLKHLQQLLGNYGSCPSTEKFKKSVCILTTKSMMVYG